MENVESTVWISLVTVTVVPPLSTGSVLSGYDHRPTTEEGPTEAPKVPKTIRGGR